MRDTNKKIDINQQVKHMNSSGIVGGFPLCGAAMPGDLIVSDETKANCSVCRAYAITWHKQHHKPLPEWLVQER